MQLDFLSFQDVAQVVLAALVVFFGLVTLALVLLAAFEACS